MDELLHGADLMAAVRQWRTKPFSIRVVQAGAIPSDPLSHQGRRPGQASKTQEQPSSILREGPNKRARLHEDEISWGSPASSSPHGPSGRSPSPGSSLHPGTAKPTSQSAAMTGRQPHQAKHALVEADIDWDVGVKAVPTGRSAGDQHATAARAAFLESRYDPDAKPSNPLALLEAQRDSSGHVRREMPGHSNKVLAGSKFLAHSNDSHSEARPVRMAGQDHTRAHSALGHSSAADRDSQPDAMQAVEKGPPLLVKRQMDTIRRLKAADSQHQSKPSMPAPKAQVKPAALPKESDIDW